MSTKATNKGKTSTNNQKNVNYEEVIMLEEEPETKITEKKEENEVSSEDTTPNKKKSSRRKNDSVVEVGKSVKKKTIPVSRHKKSLNKNEKQSGDPIIIIENSDGV